LNKPIKGSILLADGSTPDSLIPHTPRKSRTLYNAGVGLGLLKNNKWEYEIDYDTMIADKYIAHQAALKLKLKF
ncbi:hypothetical protein OAP56_03730, partial [Rickettsiaceae bacterium]|nr:hypothetical protein [Rickettsiaceae bacterium]